MNEIQIPKEQNGDLYPHEELGMEELLAQEESSLEKKSLFHAKVISIIKEGVLVDTGLKKEALIPRREFGEKIPFQVGEEISVLKISDNREDGFTTVSWKAARDLVAWQQISQSYQEKHPIRIKAIKQVRGGLTVECENGLIGFLPASQIDIRPTHDLKRWVGQETLAYILQFDVQKNNLVFSRKQWTQEEQEKKRKELLTALKVGDIRHGVVKGITSYGAFVDIGGLEGLLHVDELSWFRPKKVTDILKIGQPIDVQVLRFDPSSGKVSLSYKVLQPHPWDGIENRFAIDSVVSGKVTNLTDFGAFVEIAPHVEGLVHSSEISWEQEIKKPGEILKVGQEVSVKILSLSRIDEKVSLSIKRAEKNPWNTILKESPVGSVVQVKIVSFVPYGAFVRMANGLQGLLHVLDFSWTKKIDKPNTFLQLGSEIEVKILEIDVENERISFGIKQLKSNPFDRIQKQSRIVGKILDIRDLGIILELEPEMEGFIPVSEISNDPSEKVSDLYSVGKEVEAIVISVDPKEKKIVLSIKQLEKELQKRAREKYSKKSAGPALGQLFDAG